MSFTSSRSIADTLSRLFAVVAPRGMEVFAVIDHSGKARDAGLDLRDVGGGKKYE